MKRVLTSMNAFLLKNGFKVYYRVAKFIYIEGDNKRVSLLLEGLCPVHQSCESVVID